MGGPIYIFEENTDTLKGIVLTGEGKVKPKEVEFVKDNKRAKEIDEPVRLQILQILRNGIEDTQTTEEYNEETGERIIRERTVRRNIMSVVEIVKLSPTCDGCKPLTKNQIYHHLPILEKAGYIIKYGTVTTGKRTTDYYRRTAGGFVVTTELRHMDIKTIKKKTADFIDRTERVFDIDITDIQKEKLVKLQMRIMELEYENRQKIAEMIRGDVADEEVLGAYDWLIHLYAIGNDEYVSVQKEVRSIIFPDE